MKNWKSCLPAGRQKLKIIALLAVSFVIFFATYFALAQSQSQTGNNLFLDSDQDGFTDKEELAIGTDPHNPDTDNDGYLDGAEVRSCYNPLQPAPGDKMTADQASTILSKIMQAQPDDASLISALNSCIANLSQNSTTGQNAAADSGSSAISSSLLSSLSNNLSNSSATSDPTADPNNLTGQVINNLLQTTASKSETDSSFAANPTYTADDINQIIQSSLSGADISKNLPDISDSDIKVLPPVDDKKLTDDEKKAKEKEQIQTYLSSAAFIFAANAPFPVTTPDNFVTSLQGEEGTLISSLTSGNQKQIDDYAQKAQTGIDQLKKVEVPYVLKDIHKSILQLAIYTLSFKDEAKIDPADPLKSLGAFGSLQAVGQSVLELQSKLQSILSEYDITSIDIKQ